MSKEIKYKDVVPNSIVARYKEVRQQYEQEPVGVVRTIGGYPDDSEHIVEWLCKYKYLKDGDRLYLAPPTPEPLSDGATADMYHANKKATHPDSYWSGVYDAEKEHGIGVDDEH
jgi:hypothetical protein